jgi:hypothetical protein
VIAGKYQTKNILTENGKSDLNNYLSVIMANAEFSGSF